MRVVRAYVQEEAELRQFERLNREYVSENIRLARLSGAVHAGAPVAGRGDFADRAVGRRVRGCWRGASAWASS